MGSTSSRFVEIQVSNHTQTIALKKPRTYLGLGHCSEPPLPELSPGSSDTCRFSGDPILWGLVGTTSVHGVLVYEAESFTLAIYFSNPSEHEHLSMRLGLELSPAKAHLSSLSDTYRRMSNGIYSSSDHEVRFARDIVDESHGTTQLSHGPVKVMAAMSRGASSTLRVVLEEQKEPGEGVKTRKPWDVKGARSKRSEILRQLLREILADLEASGWPENPAGTSGTP
ncbi:uncharacterized protein [Agelaius tricolor]|uniref:uncharacterized protein n=1 Tax=Agelaius tricolor TaxID=9191 RepID=UPI0039F1AA3A